MISWIFSEKAEKEELEALKEKVNNLDKEIEELFQAYKNIEDRVKDNSENIEGVEEETQRLSQVVESLQEEIDSEEEIIELKGMEQEIFRILAQADKPLTNSEIGERMEEERDGSQVRPKLNDLKEKIAILESTKGRAKAYKLDRKAKQKIEKGETLDSIQELKK